MSKNKMQLPARKKDSHKGDYGRAFIYAGSAGMLGAAVLCSRGALRVGVGLVYLSVPKKFRDLVNLAAPETIVAAGDKVRDFSSLLKGVQAVALGPGLGDRRRFCPEILSFLNKNSFSGPVILDADGLNAFVGRTKLLKQYDLNLILTPHPGELAKLLSTTVDNVQQDRKNISLEAARLFHCLVVLKGYRTVIADPSGKVIVNPTGNPGMASGGVGDVLTGMIAGLAAQGLSAWTAAAAGVYLHGLAGDLAVRDKGEYGMIASDLIDNIPYAIRKIS